MRLSDRKNSAPIPYRDSKLTRLLRPALEGKSKVMIICNISPSESVYDESISTLKFAERAKKIKRIVHKNEVLDNSLLIKKYQEEIERLQLRLTDMEQLLEQGTRSEEINSLELKISAIQNEKGKLGSEFSKVLKEKRGLEEELPKLKSFIISSESVKNERNVAEDFDEMLIDFPTSKRSPGLRPLRKVSFEGSRDSFLLDKLEILPEILNSSDPLEKFSSVKLNDETYLSNEELLVLS